MPPTIKKEIAESFSNCSWGTNLSDPPTELLKYQVKYSRNAILSANGFYFRRGYKNIDISGGWGGSFQGIFEHIWKDGTTIILAVNNSILYSIDLTAKTKTVLYSGTGTGTASFASYLGSCFVATGGALVKVEKVSTTISAYRVGIAAPTAGTAAAAAGGTLPDGVYHVYISYARKVSSTIVLYSKPLQLSDVTLGGGSNTVSITSFANSADGQVNDKVVWMSDAAGADIYYYGETNDNTSTTVTVTSNANRNASIRMDVFAYYNELPPNFTYICAFNNMLWGSVTNVVNYSLQSSGNVYDMERFYTKNALTFPQSIYGIFSLGQDLFLNTMNGLIKIPEGKPYSQTLDINGVYFINMNTVCEYNERKIGLTNFGVRYFDGTRFSEYDLGANIRAEINLGLNTTSTYRFSALLMKRTFVNESDKKSLSRYEYHLSYNDDSLTTKNNNRRLILNLDGMFQLDNGANVTPWEVWTNGFSYGIFTRSGIDIYGVNHTTLSAILFKEDPDSTIDEGVYLEDGTLGTSTSYLTAIVDTPTKIYPLDAMVFWTHAAILRQASIKTTIIVAFDELNLHEQQVESTPADSESSYFKWDVSGSGWDEGKWTIDKPEIITHVIGENALGNLMYLRIIAIGDDPYYNFKKIEMYGQLNRNMLLWS